MATEVNPGSMISGRRLFARIPAGYVVVALFVCLLASLGASAFLLNREAVREQQEFRDNFLWMTLQYERELLTTVVAYHDLQSRPLDPAAFNVFQTRFEVLWSRIDTLIEGQLGAEVRKVERIEETIDVALRNRELIDSHIVGGAEAVRSAAADIEAVLANWLVGVREFSMRALQTRQIAQIEQRQRISWIYTLSLAFGLAAFLAGVAVAVVYFLQNRKLKKLRRNLEEIVAQRTVDLSGANRSLRREIAVREETENKLRLSRQEAEQANQSKTRFLAYMSHELRTPLNAIIGFAEMMNSELLGPIENKKYREYVGDIHASGSHLSAMLKDLLDLAKIEANELELYLTWTPLAENVANSCRVLEHMRAQAQQTVHDRTPMDIELYADSLMIRQVLVNLLSNAFKYAGNRATVSIDVEIDDVVDIVVSDDGAGIPEDVCEQLMEPFKQHGDRFTQSGDQTVPSVGGTGLGLSLSRRLARLHGGDVRLESREGAGTRAILTLPLTAMRIRHTALPATDANRASAHP